MSRLDVDDGAQPERSGYRPSSMKMDWNSSSPPSSAFDSEAEEEERQIDDDDSDDDVMIIDDIPAPKRSREPRNLFKNETNNNDVEKETNNNDVLVPTVKREARRLSSEDEAYESREDGPPNDEEHPSGSSGRSNNGERSSGNFTIGASDSLRAVKTDRGAETEALSSGGNSVRESLDSTPSLPTTSSGLGSYRIPKIKAEPDPIATPSVRAEPAATTIVKSEPGLAHSIKPEPSEAPTGEPSIEPKREPKVEGSVGGESTAEGGFVLRHVPFDQQPEIGGLPLPIDPVDRDAALAEVPPALRTMARLSLLLKERFTRLIWDSYEVAETFLKQKQDLQPCIMRLLEENHLDYEFRDRMNTKMAEVKKRDGSIVVSTRQGLRKTLIVGGMQVAIARLSSKEKADLHGVRNLLTNFVLRMINAVFIRRKDGVDPPILVTARKAYPGFIRFDKLIDDEDIGQVKTWETIKSYISTKLPKIWVPKSPEENVYRGRGDVSFGSYRGNDASRVKREPGTGGDLTSRLNRIADSRNREEYNERRSEECRRGRRDSRSVKAEPRSPLGRKSSSRRDSHSVKREPRTPPPRSEGGRSGHRDESSSRRRDSERDTRTPSSLSRGDSRPRMKEERREEGSRRHRDSESDHGPPSSYRSRLTAKGERRDEERGQQERPDRGEGSRRRESQREETSGRRDSIREHEGSRLGEEEGNRRESRREAEIGVRDYRTVEDCRQDREIALRRSMAASSFERKPRREESPYSVDRHQKADSRDRRSSLDLRSAPKSRGRQEERVVEESGRNPRGDDGESSNGSRDHLMSPSFRGRPKSPEEDPRNHRSIRVQKGRPRTPDDGENSVGSSDWRLAVSQKQRARPSTPEERRLDYPDRRSSHKSEGRPHTPEDDRRSVESGDPRSANNKMRGRPRTPDEESDACSDDRRLPSKPRGRPRTPKDDDDDGRSVGARAARSSPDPREARPEPRVKEERRHRRDDDTHRSERRDSRR